MNKPEDAVKGSDSSVEVIPLTSQETSGENKGNSSSPEVSSLTTKEEPSK